MKRQNGTSFNFVRVFFGLSLFLSCPSFSALSDEKISLFHRPDELRKVASSRTQAAGAIDKNRIHLSGLLYEGPKTWRLWVNGISFNPKTFPELKVISVTPTTVTFKTVHKGTSIAFILKPNQHYCLQEHKIGTGL